MDKIKSIGFNKKHLELGTIVKFDDDTIGIAFPEKYCKLLKGIVSISPEDNNGVFLCYEGDYIAYLGFNKFNDNLEYIGRFSECAINKIYYRRLSEQELSDILYDFRTIIQKMRKLKTDLDKSNASYIEK